MVENDGADVDSLDGVGAELENGNDAVEGDGTKVGVEFDKRNGWGSDGEITGVEVLDKDSDTELDVDVEERFEFTEGCNEYEAGEEIEYGNDIEEDTTEVY